MKTAVNLSERVAHSAKDLARRLRMPVGRLYKTAIEQYVSKHDKDGVTAALNEVYSEETESNDEKLFRRAAPKQTLLRTEW
jgi:hypothetical protein